jgi:hypothetical protein
MPNSPMPALSPLQIVQMMQEDARLFGVHTATGHALLRYARLWERWAKREEERAATGPEPSRAPRAYEARVES